MCIPVYTMLPGRHMIKNNTVIGIVVAMAVGVVITGSTQLM